MFEKAYLLFGLLAAMLYATSASALKGATERGVSSLQTMMLMNVATAIAFLTFVPWNEPTILPAQWWPPVLIGVLFFLGQLFVVLSLKHGHASITTPSMGSKVVLVALFLAFGFGRAMGLNVWAAAVLTSAGIAVLAWPGEHLPLRQVFPAVTLSVLSAASFAMFDILTQIWTPSLTFGRLMPASIIIATVISGIFIAAIDRRMPHFPPSSRIFLSLGVVLMALQSTILIRAIGKFGDAAGLNVVYGSRGVWSVLLVWLFGRHFSQHERLPRAVFMRRLAGAILIGAAVLMVFWPF